MNLHQAEKLELYGDETSVTDAILTFSSIFQQTRVSCEYEKEINSQCSCHVLSPILIPNMFVWSRVKCSRTLSRHNSQTAKSYCVQLVSLLLSAGGSSSSASEHSIAVPTRNYSV